MKRHKAKLADVPFGENFEIWGHSYTSLDGDRKGVLALEADSVTEMPFRENEAEYKVAPNDFRDSLVRDFLEGDYIAGLVSAGAKLGKDILLTEVDLKCTLGQREYGTVKTYAGLLTLEQFGLYYDVIPRTDTFWLASPWKTPRYSPYSWITDNVWVAFEDSRCFTSKYSACLGVRPSLVLSPSLLVSIEVDEPGEVKTERDAAVSDLETIMSYDGNLDTCQFCKNVKCYKRGGTHPCLPKWRGPQKEA